MRTTRNVAQTGAMADSELPSVLFSPTGNGTMDEEESNSTRINALEYPDDTNLY